jgi:hypothetical protein
MKIFRKIFLLFFVLCTGSMISFPVEKSTSTVGIGGFSIGYMKINNSELNIVLKKYGYPELKDSMFLFGGGGIAVTNGDFQWGGKGFGGEHSEAKGDRYIRMSYGTGGFMPGPAYAWENSFIGIAITIGGIGFDMKLSRKPQKFPSGEEILDDPAILSTGHIVGGGLTVGIGLNAYYYNNNGAALGVSFGKIFLPGYKWKSDNGTVLPDLPAPKSARYMTLDIFFGGNTDKLQ